MKQTPEASLPHAVRAKTARAGTLAPTLNSASRYCLEFPEMAFRVTLLGLRLMSLTATTAVTSNAEERCYNQAANVSIRP
jgi:hypothetical protein